jgi:hypothetical protein
MSDVKYLYILTACVIVVILVLTIGLFKNKPKPVIGYNLAVKTSRGLIRMNNQMLSEELAALYAHLQKYEGRRQADSFAPVISDVVDNLRIFIKQNPGTDLCKAEVKADIMQSALESSATYDIYKQQKMYKTIIEEDEHSYYTDKQMFAYMLKHIEILIKLLHSEVCDDGVFDLDKLEKLLHYMDQDLYVHGLLNKSIYTEIGSNIDIHKPAQGRALHPKSELNFTSIENEGSRRFRSLSSSTPMMLNDKLQERSELFNNDIKRSTSMYVDDETLLLGNQVTEL